MSTGSTLNLFAFNPKESLTDEQYSRYISQVEKSSNEDNAETFYPLLFWMKNSDGSEVAVFNEKPGYVLPGVVCLHAVNPISTEFGSSHSILVDKWAMRTYDDSSSQYEITLADVVQLIPVCEYISTGTVNDKTARKFEKVVFAGNSFLNVFLDALPSRSLPREYAKGDPELQEEQETVEAFCRDFAIFLNFYKITKEDYKYDVTKDVKLIYTKW